MAEEDSNATIERGSVAPIKTREPGDMSVRTVTLPPLAKLPRSDRCGPSEMQLVRVHAGNFRVSPATVEAGVERTHVVEISKPFWIGKFPVTNHHFAALSDSCRIGTNGDYQIVYFLQGKGYTDVDPGNEDDFPVAYVTWQVANSWCEKLTAREREAGRLPEGYEYRLPTEAEWEYAARGGAQRASSGDAGDSTYSDIKPVTSPAGSTERSLVGSKEANAWGIYDMMGNVGEWCLDWYDPNYYAPCQSVDPVNSSPSLTKVIRGGAGREDTGRVLGVTACRDLAVDEWDSDVGFRIVLGPVIGDTPREELIRYPNLEGVTGISWIELGEEWQESLGKTVRLSHWLADEDLRHLSGLSELQELYLAESGIGDAGLAHLDRLEGLQVLDLHDTRVSGAGLRHLLNMRKLEELDLQQTNVDDSGLRFLRGLRELRQLYVGVTGIGDEGLSHLRNLRKMEKLCLRDTQVSDVGLPHITEMKRLSCLSLAYTHVTNRGMPFLSGLGLTDLDLSGTMVSYAGILTLAENNSLHVLRLRNTDIGDETMYLFRLMRELVALDLSSTKITEEGLCDLRDVPSLRQLSLIATEGNAGYGFSLERVRANLPGVIVGEYLPQGTAAVWEW